MTLKYTIYSALAAITTHKVRSFLTILGILIGITAIMAIMSIGRGATDLIIGELDHLGANTVIVIPGDLSGESAMVDMFYAELLTERDLEAVKHRSNVPNLEELMPSVIVPGAVSYRGDHYRRAVILGGEAEFFGATFGVRPTDGQNFTDIDIRARSRVAMIGSTVKEELFGLSDAVGEHITVGDTRLRVLGVYPDIGQRGPFNIDNLILIPYTTAQTYLLGSGEFDRFIARADNPANVDRMAFDIKATLRETRNIYPGEDDDFTVMTQQSLMDQITSIMNILTAFLVFVVSIALLVGGIGIMNIMLVSVTERTREIGLRKALGATRRAILLQFLWESIILTVIGGLIGIILGAGISLAASLILTEILAPDWPFSFPLGAAGLGVAVSAVVGLLFGLYPAKQAANLDPIEALQYE